MPKSNRLVPRLVPGQRYKFGAKFDCAILYVRLHWPPQVREVTKWRDVLNEEFMYIGPEHESSGAAIHICLLTDGVLVYVTTAQFELADITKI
jgi:hypothetical protein